jgi:phenylacetate-CoA ligase
MPLIRYRTGDLAKAHYNRCACGRNTLRLGPIEGRKQQMVKLKGTTVYPPAIFEILQHVNHVADYCVEVYSGALGTDELKLHIVISGERDVVLPALQAVFQSRLRVVPEIAIISQKELDGLQHSGASRKIKKFIDSRN